MDKQDTGSEDRKTKVKFAKYYGKHFSGTMIRSTEIANRRINDLARLLVELASGAIGLVGSYIVLNPEIPLPYTKLSVVFFLFSIFAGGIQMWVDSRFFVLHAKIDGDLATMFSNYQFSENRELIADARRKLAEKSNLPTRSSLCGIYAQSLLVITAIILMVFELLSRKG